MLEYTLPEAELVKDILRHRMSIAVEHDRMRVVRKQRTLVRRLAFFAKAMVIWTKGVEIKLPTADDLLHLCS